MNTTGQEYNGLRHFANKEAVPFELVEVTDGHLIDQVRGKQGSPYEGVCCIRKRIPLSTFQGSALETMKAFTKEVKALRAAQHSHVVKLIADYFLENDHFAIIMERADGDLSKYIRSEVDELLVDQFASWFTCLARAMDYLHGIGIRHRDMKPENILIRDNKVLIADFGISVVSLKRTLSTTDQNRKSARTERWAAPEVLDGGSRDSQADIFSLGAVFLEMLHAHSYWFARGNLTDALKGQQSTYGGKLDDVHGHIADIFEFLEEEPPGDNWAKEVLKICQGMLSEDPFERPQAAKVLEKLEELSPPICPCHEDEDASENDRLLESCRKHNISKVKQRLDNGADPTTLGAIHHAASRRGVEFVEALLESTKADHKLILLNQRNYSGQTPLHCAISYGDINVVQYLIEAGADLLVNDDDGDTPLHCAAGYGHCDVIKYLLFKQKERLHIGREGQLLEYINRRDRVGRTALHCAVRRGHQGVVESLLKAQADASIGDDMGRKPLHLAAHYGCMKMVNLLLKWKAVPDEKDSEGRTALFYAASGRRRGGEYPQVLSALVELGVLVDWGDIVATRGANKEEGRTKILNNAHSRTAGTSNKEIRRATHKWENTPGGRVFMVKSKVPRTPRSPSRTTSFAPERDRTMMTTTPTGDSTDPDIHGTNLSRQGMTLLQGKPELVTRPTSADFRRMEWQPGRGTPPRPSDTFSCLSSALHHPDDTVDISWNDNMHPGNVRARWRHNSSEGQVLLTDGYRDAPLSPMLTYMSPQEYQSGRQPDEMFLLSAIFLKMAAAAAGLDPEGELQTPPLKNGSRRPICMNCRVGISSWIRTPMSINGIPNHTELQRCTQHMMAQELDQRPSATELLDTIRNSSKRHAVPYFGTWYESHMPTDLTTFPRLTWLPLPAPSSLTHPTLLSHPTVKYHQAMQRYHASKQSEAEPTNADHPAVDPPRPRKMEWADTATALFSSDTFAIYSCAILLPVLLLLVSRRRPKTTFLASWMSWLGFDTI